MSDALALDRESVRSKDKFGRLHVAVSNISKANVCPYRGSEIPGYEQLGLDRERVYHMWRAPEELAKAAATSNNVPLMSMHVPQSAANSQKDRIVGSTGTDAEFAAPYLCNSLVVWDDGGIDAIESGRARELSCAYSYEPDMVPGKTPDGVAYDGVMRNIKFNHVALVPDGRAGDDVVVGDAATVVVDYVPTSEELARLERALEQESGGVSKSSGAPKAYLSRQSPRAAAVRGALTAYLVPKLAADARMPNLASVVAGVDSRTYGVLKKTVAERLEKAVEGRLAKDANLKDVHGLLDRLDGEEERPEGEEREVPMKAKDAPDQTRGEGPPEEEVDPEETNIGLHENPEGGMSYAVDADVMERLREFLAEKLAPEDVDAVEAMLKPAEATVEGEEAEERAKHRAMAGEDRTRGHGRDQGLANFGAKRAPPIGGKDHRGSRDHRMSKDHLGEKAVDKHAMDAAIATTARETEKRTIARLNAIHAAIREVRPYAGNVDAMAFDSAEAVYKFALEKNKVDLASVHPSAYRPMLAILKARGEASTRPGRLATDAAPVEGFATRWPGADRVRVM